MPRSTSIPEDQSCSSAAASGVEDQYLQEKDIEATAGIPHSDHEDGKVNSTTYLILVRQG